MIKQVTTITVCLFHLYVIGQATAKEQPPKLNDKTKTSTEALQKQCKVSTTTSTHDEEDVVKYTPGSAAFVGRPALATEPIISKIIELENEVESLKKLVINQTKIINIISNKILEMESKNAKK